MRVQQRALKKTGKDSGIRAFISVSTWEISTLYRVPLCLCLLSSFRVSVEKKGMHSAACKLWGWTLGLCFVSLGRRGGRGGEGAKEKKKEARIGRALLHSRYTRYFRKSSQSTSKLNNFPDVYESGSIASSRVIMENGDGLVCTYFGDFNSSFKLAKVRKNHRRGKRQLNVIYDDYKDQTTITICTLYTRSISWLGIPQFVGLRLEKTNFN